MKYAKPVEDAGTIEQPEYDALGNPTGGTVTVRRPAPAKDDGKPGMLESAARGALQGTTLNASDEMYAIGAGALARARGGEFGPEYDRRLSEAQAADHAAREANPWTYGIGQAAGLVPGLVYGGSTALGAKALGLVGRNFLTRSGMSAASGAANGGAQGAAGVDTGESRTDGAMYGAAGGGALGAASPAIGAAIGAGTGAVINAVRSRMGSGSTGAAAGEALAQDIRAAGGPQAVRDRMAELGLDGMLLDTSPSFLGRAQSLAVRPETREMIVDPLIARNAGTNARLATDIDSALGRAPTPSRIEADLTASRAAVSEQYGPVMDGARAVDTSSLAARLETNAVNLRGPARAAAQKVRGFLDIPGNPGQLDPNPMALHQTRQAIDGLLDGETNRTVRYILTEAHKDVDKLLGSWVPGIKAVDARQAELFRQSEGLQRGSQLFDGGKTAIRPAEFADEFRAAALPQGEMIGPSAVPLRIQQGARGEIDRVVGTHANDLNEMRKLLKGEGDWNYTKLIQTYGSERAARIWNAVDREAAFRQVHQDVVQVSQSAQRLAAAEGTKVRGEGGAAAASVTGLAGAVGGPQAAAMAAAAQGGRMAANQIMKAADLARNYGLARTLTMRQGPELDQVIEQAAKRIQQAGRTNVTMEQARELAQIMLKTQGENAGSGVRSVAGMLR